MTKAVAVSPCSWLKMASQLLSIELVDAFATCHVRRGSPPAARARVATPCEHGCLPCAPLEREGGRPPRGSGRARCGAEGRASHQVDAVTAPLAHQEAVHHGRREEAAAAAARDGGLHRLRAVAAAQALAAQRVELIVLVVAERLEAARRAQLHLRRELEQLVGLGRVERGLGVRLLVRGARPQDRVEQRLAPAAAARRRGEAGGHDGAAMRAVVRVQIPVTTASRG